MPTIIREFHTELIETIRDNARANRWWSSPVNLGGVAGVSGGIGAPVGGLFGQLIQSKIAYDTSEASYSGILNNPPSGSLVDNLAHIRHRIQVLESGGIAGEITIKENGIVIASGITVIDFIGGDVELTGPGEVTVSGGFTSDFSLWEPDSPPVASGIYDDEFNDLSLDPKWIEWDVDAILALTETEHGLDMVVDSTNPSKWAGIYQQHDNSDITIYTKVTSLGLQFAGEIKAGIILGSGIFTDPSTADFGKSVV